MQPTVFNLTNVQEIYLLYIAAELKKGGYAEIQQNDCPLLIDWLTKVTL